MYFRSTSFRANPASNAFQFSSNILTHGQYAAAAIYHPIAAAAMAL
jgi:hypothetical protein